MAFEVKEKAPPVHTPGPPASDTVTPPPSHPPDHIALRNARRSADRLIAIEQDLVRRIVGQYELDRRLQHLLIELQICSTRMRKQLNECTAAPDTDDSDGRLSLSETE